MARKIKPSITSRFTGRDGKSRLVEEMCVQSLVAGDREAAQALVRKCSLRTFPAGKELTLQGEQDNDIYFILSGTVSVLVNSRELATRSRGDHVGEMAMADRTAVRSATVKALEHTVVAAVAEPDFSRIADKHPLLWRRLAVTIAERLRQRNRFHPPPRQVPVAFIGSSAEGLKIAEAIDACLCRRSIVTRLWSEGVFQCSKPTLEDLIRANKESDFAVLVLTADDVTTSRRQRKVSPRDNVVFELGLFMGALSPERTYFVVEDGVDIKIPTDLLGIGRLPYRRKRGRSLGNCLRRAIRTLCARITQLGPR